MITLKQLKDKLHKDFGWKNLESNDNKWFVDNLLKDTIQAINYTQDKTLKNKHKKSMLLWIITNKKMSLSRKIYKFWIYLTVRLGNYFRQGSQCTLICAFYEPKPSHFQRLLRRTELLMKKGHKVRLKLSLSEKQLSHIDSESEMLLIRLINLLKTKIY